ncbi:DUF1059 domain-containing protein [Corallococcus macrosporus]|uniref:DUF1059 domain-containing protein n=1 Tax=Corallococcus macrosporus DSM 14697 TaxID=1189310 RepID=A0A250K2T1_9BACT|nr:DUF1059 domain-containing protein [Corallococcus macrosporus]ATB50409.1 hypothetical protein MYMAC_006065 [Corallococcus macrosporus DSM 14697]
MSRKTMDCRKAPSDIHCTLTISGEEDEVFNAAVAHAVSAHGHEDSAELREMIRGLLEDEEPSAGIGRAMPMQEPQQPSRH